MDPGKGKVNGAVKHTGKRACKHCRILVKEGRDMRKGLIWTTDKTVIE